MPDPSFYPASRTLNAPKTLSFGLPPASLRRKKAAAFRGLDAVGLLVSNVGPLVALWRLPTHSSVAGGFRSMKQRLLLVDDSKIFLDLTSKFLREKGFEVDTAISGELALEHMRKARVSYALVVLDYAMGDKNGANTARDI